MKKNYYLLLVIFLVISIMAVTASAYTTEEWSTSGGYTSAGNTHEQEANQAALTQDQVTLTLYVLDGGINGPLLPGVAVSGQDAAGNSFEGMTNSNGAIVIKGQPGTWQFTLVKDGYKTRNANYDITETHSAATYLQRTDLSQGQVTQSSEQVAQPREQTAQSQELVTLTAYIHEGSLNGTALSGVKVTGQDATGSSFEGITDSNGAVVIDGQPGTWQFTFTKEGYDTLNLNYTVTETEEAAAYLQKAVVEQVVQPQVQVAQSQEQVTEPQEPVILKAYVYEGSLNGTALSGVKVTGQDATGNSFEGMTGSDGAVVISGQPGTWQFAFTKEGYDTLNLNYDVIETEEAAAYLQKTA